MENLRMAQGVRDQRVSYRGKLAVIPGAFEVAFQIDDHYDDEKDDNVGPEEDDGVPPILLTRLEKLEMRAPWRRALVVKPFGKPIKHRISKQRLLDLWRPLWGMDVVGIGNGFSTVSFHNREDRARVLRDRSWFINYKILSIRRWQPNFNRGSFDMILVGISMKPIV